MSTTSTKPRRTDSISKSPRRTTTKTRKQSPASTATPNTDVTDRNASYEITIRHVVGDKLCELAFETTDRRLYPIAQEWRYVVANRRRITDQTRDTLSAEVFMRLHQLKGGDEAELLECVKSMARARLIEVAIPWENESTGWAARVFPWESVLALLTKPYRQEDFYIPVLRYLELSKPRPRPGPPTSVLVVRSGPGEIGRLFDLQPECDFAVAALGLAPAGGSDPVLREPDRETLSTRLKSGPSVVHFSGVDPSALQGIGVTPATSEYQDGFVLRGNRETYDPVSPQQFARLLGEPDPKPLLVATAVCYSAARVAPLAVAAGVRHAIGFQDTVTDAESMLFFSAFYRPWALNWNLLHAFTEARTKFAAQTHSQSAGGVVLWSDRSLLLESLAPPEPEAAATPQVMASAAQPQFLKFHIEPRADLNYSLLHNNRSPFKSFMVMKFNPGPLPPLRVEVALEVGDEVCRCRFAEPLPESEGPIQLADKIRLPLVAALLRQCTESLRTNLYVQVHCGNELLCERSERITVLPADEWRDDGEDHRWLPSFVLPRDPAVLRVIVAAQRYLRTLLDDCAAGFDGYQRVFEDDSNAVAVVDPQVQAIWAALQHDLPLAYINPPPSYTSQSQRLRSPSQIFDGNAATCIDLALLFASCLEFVGIYPVIFLVTGHAFPGYWRSERAWLRMKQLSFKNALPAAESVLEAAAPKTAAASARAQGEGWMFAGVDNLAELLTYIQAGTLVPFESTCVTGKKGFFQSLELGSSQLHPGTFDAMIDVQSARGENVTPLPFVETRR